MICWEYSHVTIEFTAFNFSVPRFFVLPWKCCRLCKTADLLANAREMYKSLMLSPFSFRNSKRNGRKPSFFWDKLNSGRPLHSPRFNHPHGDYLANVCHDEPPCVQFWPVWGKIVCFNLIIDRVNPVLGYCDTPEVSVPYTVGYFDHLLKNRSGVFEVGR